MRINEKLSRMVAEVIGQHKLQYVSSIYRKLPRVIGVIYIVHAISYRLLSLLRWQRYNIAGEERSLLHFVAELLQVDARLVLVDCSDCTRFVRDSCDRKCCTNK